MLQARRCVSPRIGTAALGVRAVRFTGRCGLSWTRNTPHAEPQCAGKCHDNSALFLKGTRDTNQDDFFVEEDRGWTQ